ncbi:MAG TPA: cytochrome c [Alphaproteobacteria bacterium]|nr:cytochrome c [Alphaproteobacteria bacterium]
MRAPGLALAALALLSCGSPRRGEPVAPPPRLGAEAQRGEAAFMAWCNECHPRGEAGLGPALNNKPMPGPLIAWQVRHGLGAMPAFPEETLPEPELAALVAYLKALRAGPAP